MCVCVRVAVSPVGLSGYGLAAGEVAEQTQEGIIVLAHYACKRLSCLPLFPLCYGGKWTHRWERPPANRALQVTPETRTAMGRRARAGRRRSVGNAFLTTRPDCGLDIRKMFCVVLFCF